MFKNVCRLFQVIETDEEFQPFPGGYDYLVDFLDLSFPKQRPEREHAYLEVGYDDAHWKKKKICLLQCFTTFFLLRHTFHKVIIPWHTID